MGHLADYCVNAAIDEQKTALGPVHGWELQCMLLATR
jgi:hypothetical protein